MWRVVVCDQETSKNEEAKDRYRAVKIQPKWVVTPGKQTNKPSVYQSRLWIFQIILLEFLQISHQQHNSFVKN
jgi:hypothetical protein